MLLSKGKLITNSLDAYFILIVSLSVRWFFLLYIYLALACIRFAHSTINNFFISVMWINSRCVIQESLYFTPQKIEALHIDRLVVVCNLWSNPKQNKHHQKRQEKNALTTPQIFPFNLIHCGFWGYRDFAIKCRFVSFSANFKIFINK